MGKEGDGEGGRWERREMVREGGGKGGGRQPALLPQPANTYSEAAEWPRPLAHPLLLSTPTQPQCRRRGDWRLL